MAVPDVRPLRSAVLGITAGLALAALGSVFAVAPAMAGEPTSSAKTVTAKDYDPDYADSPFPDLKVTVSQTEDLIQQGITVSWTGGTQSSVPNQQTGGANFLQIMQCWGDEAGSNGTRPDRTTCQYGGFNLPGDSRYSNRSSSATIAAQDEQYTAKGSSFFDPTMTAIPFTSITGTKVASIVDGKRVADAPDLNSNEFFTKYTTNEVSWGGTGADGSGSVGFELQTVQQSPGLGCGKPITTGTVTTGQPCWLVVIPRGESDPDGSYVTRSGLFWDTWKHHIAIRLDFKPNGLRCAIGAAERQLSGSELISSAVGQWQPALCNKAGGAVYSLLTGPESDAALAANGVSPAPMALVSRPIDPEAATDNLSYAPVALTGVSIAFSIDRQADTTASAEVSDKERLAFTSLKLTPRLLAKLLTASYQAALPAGADTSQIKGNPSNITKDPDFLKVNDPEWAQMGFGDASVGLSDLLLPLGRSDAAEAVWNYVLADPDAKAFMEGKADPWGMKVNPYYSTKASVNPTGTGLALPREDFPKADPSEFAGYANHDYADVVNLVTWRPYTSSLDAGGYDVLRGDALVLGDWDQTATPPKYGRAPRALVGLQKVLGITDSAAAAKYQTYQASLLNPAGEYVAPTTASLSAAAAAMTADPEQKQVVEFDPTSSAARTAAAAYPLAMPIYAAVNPAMTGSDLRGDYARFISTAVTSGQNRGTDDGELPDGYAAIPSAWKKQALAAAAAIKSGASSSTTGTTTSSSTSTSAGTSPGISTTTTDPSSNPAASGDPASSLHGSPTPPDPAAAPFTMIVPATAAAGALAALAIPLVSRLRRRQP